MGKKEQISNRRYTDEFKGEAVRLAESIGGNATAKRLGVPQSTVTNWVRRRRALPVMQEVPAALSRRPISELEAENARLRQQLTETRAQRAEYMQFISELLPPYDLPSEEEMAEQMKNLVPAEQVLREMREARKLRESNGP